MSIAKNKINYNYLNSRKFALLRELMITIKDADRAYEFGEQLIHQDHEYDYIREQATKLLKDLKDVYVGSIYNDDIDQELSDQIKRWDEYLNLAIRPTYGNFKNYQDVKHYKAVIGATKIRSIYELSTTAASIGISDLKEVMVEPKYDGISLSLYYKRGILVHAATRGTGLVGKDLLPILKKSAVVPQSVHSLTAVPETQIDGELIISKSNYEYLQSKFNTNYGSPRSMLVSSLSRVNREEILNYLDYFPYTFRIEERNSKKIPSNVISAFKNKQHFNIYKTDDENPIMPKILSEIEKDFELLDYVRDGVVITAFDEGYYNSNSSIALKFYPTADSVMVTSITKIKHRTERISRKITPVLKVEPIYIGGKAYSTVILKDYRPFIEERLAVGVNIEVGFNKDRLVYQQVEGQQTNPDGSRNYYSSEHPDECPECGAVISKASEYEIKCSAPASECFKSKSFANAAKFLFDLRANDHRIKDPIEKYKPTNLFDFIKCVITEDPELELVLKTKRFSYFVLSLNLKKVTYQNFDALGEILAHAESYTDENHLYRVARQLMKTNCNVEKGVRLIKHFLEFIKYNDDWITDYFNYVKEVASK